MSDYVSRLIGNSRTQEAPIRPRQRQLFETPPSAGSLLPAPEPGSHLDVGLQHNAVTPTATAVRTAASPSVRVGDRAELAPSTRPDYSVAITARPAEPFPVLTTLKPQATGIGRNRDGASSTTPALTSEEASPAPVIRVTIGRVEVRAVQPPASPATGKSPEQKAVMTLDEYLKSRRGNQR